MHNVFRWPIKRVQYTSAHNEKKVEYLGGIQYPKKGKQLLVTKLKKITNHTFNMADGDVDDIIKKLIIINGRDINQI
ncbi:hypothetical protein Hanom_Chr14g01310781 [Helianthus anomalus]